MKKLLLFLIVIISTSLHSSGQDAQWVRTIKSQGYDDCRDMCTDSSGNIFVTGQIEYTADFGGYNLSSYGGHDIFVAKYDSAGNLKWAKRAGGPSGDVGYSVAIDREGSVFVVGEFEQTANFSGIQVTIQGDGNNMFIAKYDSSGSIQWVKTIGTNAGSTKGYAVACDDQGYVYACGTTASRAYLDGTRLFSTRGASDIILIKLDTHGDYEWHKQIGGTDSDKGYGLAVSDGFVYVTGSFEGSCEFSSITLNSNGGLDFFLAKYNDQGSVQWAKKGGSSSDDIGWDVVVNNNGNIVCTGEFSSNATFSSNSINSNGNTDMFITAYSETGSNLWVENGGGSGMDVGRNIATDRKSNLYVGGSFSYTAGFGQFQLSSNGDEDLFMVSYDSIGTARYVKHFGGPGNDRGRGVGTDRYGNVYFSGEYWNHITFDNIYTPGLLLFDGFITRLGNYPVCTTTAGVLQNISCYNACDGVLMVHSIGEAPYNYTWQTSPTLHTDTINSQCSGTYPVEVTDAFGCISRDTLQLVEPAILLIDSALITDVSCIGCSNGSINLYPAGGTPPYSYLWSDGETTEDRINIPDGTYNICIEDANLCTVCDSFVVMTHTASINSARSFSNVMQLYPNPASKMVEIIIKENSLGIENYLMKLYSLSGQVIFERKLNINEMSFSVNELPAGLYFVQFITLAAGGDVFMAPLFVE